ncbi:hypothetical protein [Kingella sp. (in: b-proteobacteria)]|uniref:hypothetical protein n=1 Tax=Kingella sp. (in: b-proteobacteria) TaxID=2020713 RepID=UPI0026DC4DA1|nr:hypothetical protein [Kingella sp. (in: b-proteobacteria)]MDO4657378.1 hypothetical protein [Kingella sp. (in: b-proteobacteria)]
MWVGWGSLKKGLAYGGGFQAAAYMVGGMDWACINVKAEIFAKSANDEASAVRRQIAPVGDEPSPLHFSFQAA